VLLVALEGYQRAVDEVDYAGFARAGRVVGGNDLGSHGLDLDRLLRAERAPLGWLRRSGRLLCVRLGGQDSGPI
jgi:hypothetical protein